jgi:hypothetical protein
MLIPSRALFRKGAKAAQLTSKETDAGKMWYCTRSLGFRSTAEKPGQRGRKAVG